MPEVTGSHVHDKNMHTLLACNTGPIFFLPIILFSFSVFCIFSDTFSSFFQLPALASASIVSVLYSDMVFLHMYASSMLTL